MAPRRRPRPATASRIIAAGVAVGTASGAVAFMAVNDPQVVVRTVASPAPPVPAAKVIVFEVQHQPAPIVTPGTVAPAAAPRATRSNGSGVTSSSARTGAPAAGPTPAPAPAASAPAPARAPAPAPAPAPTTKTGPS